MRGKFTYAPMRPELCLYLGLGILIRKVQKKSNFVYTHHSPTATLNTMGITSEKVEKSTF